MSDATVVFERVSRWYGAKVAVAEVSFELEAGVTGLLGHNGAGKTTAMRLAAGFCAPSIGTVRVCGVTRSAIRAPTWTSASSTTATASGRS